MNPGQQEGYLRGSRALLALTGAAILPYLPFLHLPTISDTYTQIFLARVFVPASGWADLASDVLYRCRATSLVLTYAVDALFGSGPEAHRWLNILLHVFNTWLVLWLGRWPAIGYRVSIPAALFFAVYEGHQEAVVWVAALPELLVFAFALGAVHAWIAWEQSGWQRHIWAAAAAVSYVLALASKESAVAVVPVLAWMAWRGAAPRRVWTALGAGVLVAGAYAAAIFAAGSSHLHLNDAGTFSLAAPFWFILPNSLARMLWFWGATAAAILLLARRGGRALEFAAVWAVCTLLPYSFLLYMNRVPSRHTYLASAGLALLIGMAYAAFRERNATRWFPAAAALVLIAHNCGYLWVKKLPQYEKRAQVTERFFDFARARQTQATIRVKCAPYGFEVFQHAAAVRLGRPPATVVPADWDGSADDYCDSEHP